VRGKGLMLERVDLGREAAAYIRWSLSESRRALSSYLQALPLEAGRMFTFVPSDAEHSRLSEFRAGVLHGRGSYESLAKLALAYLAKDGRRYLIFEDVFVEVGNAWLEDPTIQYFTYGAEVYHFLAVESATEETVLQTIDNAKGYVTNGILTGGSSLPLVQSGSCLDMLQLQALAEAADYILVEAYDGEGFLVWTRR